MSEGETAALTILSSCAWNLEKIFLKSLQISRDGKQPESNIHIKLISSDNQETPYKRILKTTQWILQNLLKSREKICAYDFHESPFDIFFFCCTQWFPPKSDLVFKMYIIIGICKFIFISFPSQNTTIIEEFFAYPPNRIRIKSTENFGELIKCC